MLQTRSGRYIYHPATGIDSQNSMPPSTEDNLGRRRFLLHRDKAVEHALERIRHAAGADLETLSAEQHSRLKAFLAELWMDTAHERWDQYCFSTLTRTDLMQLIALGTDWATRHHLTSENRQALEEILLSCSEKNPSPPPKNDRV